MKQYLVLIATCAGILALMLTAPNFSHAAPPPEAYLPHTSSDGGPGIGNYLFQRWAANRQGTAFYSNYRDWRRDNADNSGVLTQTYDQWLQNRGTPGGLFARRR